MSASSALLLPHVSKARPVFLNCDLQEKFAKAIPAFDQCVFVANRMLQFASLRPRDCLFVVTDHYPKGLGRTIESIKLDAAPPELSVKRFDKTLFSMYTPEVAAAMHAHVGSPDLPAKRAVLWGIEAHVCVLQTAEDLSRAGWHVSVLADGTYSQRDLDRKYALKLLEKMPNVTLTTSESVLFQLIRDATDPDFKAMSALVRQQPPPLPSK